MVARNYSLYLMSFLYIVAGIIHFVHPSTYMSIMPQWLPWHLELIYLSGFLEVFFGVLLLFSTTRRWAALGIIIMLIAIFPANIQMVINYANENNKLLWLSIIRLPLQIVLIRWAYKFIRGTKKKLTTVKEL
jgi:uncharacterized membrane protein